MASRVSTVVRTVVSVIVLSALVLGGAIAFQNRQIISDHFAAQNFTPSPQVGELTETLMLTDSGHRIFFASEPTLDSSQLFNEQCAQVAHAEGGHVLGCYVSGRIHLFQVTDERLSGIVEATAVHELLHAVFARLNPSERDRITELLTETFAVLTETQPELAERMSVYDDLTAVGYANELHSVLATEVRELPAELDAHYDTWLLDRARIVDFFDASHGVFVELQQRANELESEMLTLRTDIERRNSAYDAAVTEFNRDVASLAARNSNFEFSDDREGFYAQRDSLNLRRDWLNSELVSIQSGVAQYEEMRQELQQLGEINSELLSHLNSELAPPSSAPVAQ